MLREVVTLPSETLQKASSGGSVAPPRDMKGNSLLNKHCHHLNLQNRLVRRVRLYGLVICFLALSPLPAHAGPGRFFKKLGHAIATHKLLLAEAAVMELSAQPDIHSSEAAMRRCPACEEGNFFLPSRPSALEFQGAAIANVIAFSAANWYELRIGNDPECPVADKAMWCKKGFWQGLTLSLTGENVGLHLYGKYHNDGIGREPY